MKKYLGFSLIALIMAGQVIPKPIDSLSDFQPNSNSFKLTGQSALRAKKIFKESNNFLKESQKIFEKSKKNLQGSSADSEIREIRFFGDSVKINGKGFKIKDGVLFNSATDKPANEKEVKQYNGAMVGVGQALAGAGQAMDQAMAGAGQAMAGAGQAMVGAGQALVGAMTSLLRIEDLKKQTPIKTETKPNGDVVKTFASGEQFSYRKTNFKGQKSFEYKYLPNNQKKVDSTYSSPKLVKRDKVKTFSLITKKSQPTNKVLAQKKRIIKPISALQTHKDLTVNQPLRWSDFIDHNQWQWSYDKKKWLKTEPKPEVDYLSKLKYFETQIPVKTEIKEGKTVKTFASGEVYSKIKDGDLVKYEYFPDSLKRSRSHFTYVGDDLTTLLKRVKTVNITPSSK